MAVPADSEQAAATLLDAGRHPDPFGFLGIHQVGDSLRVRTYQPQAETVGLVDPSGTLLMPMNRVGSTGLFVAELTPGGSDSSIRYRVRIGKADGTETDLDDAYCFSSVFGELDLHLIGEGSHRSLYEQLGAHRVRHEGVDGVRFGVWAPNASRVSVVGAFNDWDGRRHSMRRHPPVGTWDIFVPGIEPGCKYKFELLDAGGAMLPLKADPYTRFSEQPPGNASIVFETAYRWRDQAWIDSGNSSLGFDRPISIYEVHIGSWRRKADEHNRWLNYREMADQLVPYLVEMGFTHVELLPVSEHPFGGSWGYQPIGLFAPTSRSGSPDDFRCFVDQCHRHGIGVILDWVGAHFPSDEHGLGRFDGSALYEHADPRLGVHADWDTLVFNYGRVEVANYLIANALYWVREFHIDALRLDAVASMLYLDYSREAGEWLPNEFGGNENLAAIAFLRRLNTLVHAEGAVTIAEESTAWSGVTRPPEDNGLGFSYKWNMGWMNDTLRYMAEDPVHRRYHHDRMTFSMVYAFNENFMLPLSHDEVVHGKRSLIGRMPGDRWQRLANLRCYFAFMFAHPGKKLLFMGDEFGQIDEWHHDRSLDWHLLDDPGHRGVQRLVQDLNRLYTSLPSLHEIDYRPAGFRWINCEDRENSVVSLIRFDRRGKALVSISNLTPIVRDNYRFGVPVSGTYAEILNTDAEVYGGSGVGNLGSVDAVDSPRDWLPATISLRLPPLATVYLTKESRPVGLKDAQQ
jgi:1,4-alpha-glucan branching enzyme